MNKEDDSLLGRAFINYNLLVTDYIDEHSDMFSMWEAKARYVLGYLIEYRKIEKAIREVEIFLSAVEKQREHDYREDQANTTSTINQNSNESDFEDKYNGHLSR